MPEMLENQNTKDIRYIDEKVDRLKTDFNKACNKQGQITAKIDGQVASLERQLETNTNRLETKIDRVQADLTENLNSLTASISKLTATQEAFKNSQESMQQTLEKLADVQLEMRNHSARLDSLEKDKQDKLDIKKEKIKSNATIIVAFISGLLALAGIIVSTFAK